MKTKSVWPTFAAALHRFAFFRPVWFHLKCILRFRFRGECASVLPRSLLLQDRFSHVIHCEAVFFSVSRSMELIRMNNSINIKRSKNQLKRNKRIYYISYLGWRLFKKSIKNSDSLQLCTTSDSMRFWQLEQKLPNHDAAELWTAKTPRSTKKVHPFKMCIKSAFCWIFTTPDAFSSVVSSPSSLHIDVRLD